MLKKNFNIGDAQRVSLNNERIKEHIDTNIVIIEWQNVYIP